ncbi:hypothetical protein JYU34_017644 [Plutella xylostella]|uniref:Uncharacterized protein n=1 Tax=Plutella xylostella TaxID=51655 RepID=A0ABQ7Q2Z4_PLUXY|nr:hypothetical protein JYU34_017644 [Plutella xylostella]
MVETIGTTIGIQIPNSSVTDVHRVASNQPSQKPKNIIVHLSSRRLRDDVIAAARSGRGLTAAQVLEAAAGGPTACSSVAAVVAASTESPPSEARVYINEHLTLKNKLLYAKARVCAKDKSYRYIWIKMLPSWPGKRITPASSQSDVRKILNFFYDFLF